MHATYELVETIAKFKVQYLQIQCLTKMTFILQSLVPSVDVLTKMIYIYSFLFFIQAHDKLTRTFKYSHAKRKGVSVFVPFSVKYNACFDAIWMQMVHSQNLEKYIATFLWSLGRFKNTFLCLIYHHVDTGCWHKNTLGDYANMT